MWGIRARGTAAAAIGAVMAVGLVTGLSGCALIENILEPSQYDETIVRGGNTDVTALSLGDCFSMPEGDPGSTESFNDSSEFQSVDVLDCGLPHGFEIYASGDIELDGSYPADADLDAEIGRICNPSFRDFVGVPYRRSTLVVSSLLPTEEGWQLGDRHVSCLVFLDDAGTLRTGTLRDSMI